MNEDELLEIFKPLIGVKLDWLSIPEEALQGFEPSQIAIIINTLLDAAMPQIKMLAADDPENAEKLAALSLSKAPRLIGEREGYPDFLHESGLRVELKGLFVDSPDLHLKRPPTRREPSARLNEHVTIDIIDPDKDVLLVAATQIRCVDGWCTPVIVDVGAFRMVAVIEARDSRLMATGGKWDGFVPKVVSNKGRQKLRLQEPLDEPDDFERDTNFGKLRRIPYQPLEDFLDKYKPL